MSDLLRLLLPQCQGSQTGITQRLHNSEIRVVANQKPAGFNPPGSKHPVQCPFNATLDLVLVF